MRDYKGWTGQERLASLKKTKEAIAAGIIPPPTKCNRCGKTNGRIDYHNHDYSDPVKYLEMLCQGCHTRLHRMENRAQTEATAIGTVTIEASPTPSAPAVTIKNATTCSASNNRDKMHSIRVDFTKALGIDWSENQNPDSGYKFEYNLNRRQQYLDEAIKLRDQYAELVATTGKGRDILQKMNSNLENRDRRATWR